jgi:hypothetical protein
MVRTELKNEKIGLNNRYKRLCPVCHSSNLKHLNQIMAIFNQPQFYCPDCGYKGQIYVDSAPNDKFDEKIEKEFLKENPEFLESRKPAWKLAQESLKEKWIPNQKRNQHKLEDWCPFCENVQVICSICKCPSDICSNQATNGLVGELNRKYSKKTLLCDIDSDYYNQIVKRMQEVAHQKE